METQQSLIDEVKSAIASGSSEKQAETLRRVTDFFLTRADDYSEKQVDVFDRVMSQLARQSATAARAELAQRLAPLKNAPPAVIHALARDAAIEVAGPVLSQSRQLTEQDLLACANGKGDAWLLAIARRTPLSETLSDLLVMRGNADVHRAVAKNEGAWFSSAGFGKLVEESTHDEQLAVSLGMRQDIPHKYFHTLGCNASEPVFKKFVNAIVRAQESKIKRDYTQAKALVDSILRAKKPAEPAIQDFASSGKFEEIVVALSVLCRLPVEEVEDIMLDKRVNNDLILILAKRAGLSWRTAQLILQLHCGEQDLSPEAIATAHAHFDHLQAATVQRVVRFHHARYGGDKKPMPASG